MLVGLQEHIVDAIVVSRRHSFLDCVKHAQYSFAAHVFELKYELSSIHHSMS
jgi:hypothetical protein